MRRAFERETEGVFRLRVPFEGIDTSVFLLETDAGVILVDCATTDADVEDWILPALAARGYAPIDLSSVVLTHRHEDHAGGLPCLLQHAPSLAVITDVRPLWDGISTYPLPGHTEDMIGVLDERTRTLITGDGLQGAGVDKYRCYLKRPTAYLETLKNIEADGRVENLLLSHAYEPWNTDAIRGRENVIRALRDCATYVKI
ncbi:MAG: MBL fold metallo-hydrolase [Clostridia bacterium]|nr:MBL fold metallo-hydrolase [Clostridia bacterium]